LLLLLLLAHALYSIAFIVLTLLTTYLTSWIRVLLEKPTVELVKTFPAF